jgi:hypothetical protein
MKKALMNATLVLLGIAVALILLEGLLRLTPYARLISPDPVTPRDYFRADKVNGYDIDENRSANPFRLKECSFDIWSNEIGCFDRPYGGEKHYILLVGDSFSWGYVPYEDNWGGVLESATGRRVLKCGVPGYGTKNAHLKAKSILARLEKKPEVLLVGYFYNDLLDDYLFPRYRVLDGQVLEGRILADPRTGEIREKTDPLLREEMENWSRFGVPHVPQAPAIKRLKRYLNEHSVLYRVVQPALTALVERAPLSAEVRAAVLDPPSKNESSVDILFASPETLPWLSDAWKNHFGNIRRLKEWAGEEGIRLVVVLIPTREQVYGFLPGATARQDNRPGRMVGRFLQQEGISYVDLLPVFQRYADQRPRRFLDPEKDLYWALDSHWSPRGSRLAGLHIARYLVAEKIVEESRPEDIIREIDMKVKHLTGGMAQ